MTGRHVGQNRLKTVSGRSHAWFRKFGAQTFLVFESREETQIRPIVQGGKKDFFPFKMDRLHNGLVETKNKKENSRVFRKTQMFPPNPELRMIAS